MRLVLRRCHVRFDVWQWHVTESPDLQQAWGGDIYIAGQANAFWARRNLLKASHKHLLGSEPNDVLLLVKKQSVSPREEGLHIILVFLRDLSSGGVYQSVATTKASHLQTDGDLKSIGGTVLQHANVHTP